MKRNSRLLKVAQNGANGSFQPIIRFKPLQNNVSTHQISNNIQPMEQWIQTVPKRFYVERKIRSLKNPLKPQTDIPAEDMPKPVVTYGNENIKVAYLLERAAILKDEYHPIEWETMRVQDIKRSHYARNHWTDRGFFTEFIPAWMKAKQDHEKNRKAKKSKGSRTYAKDKLFDIPEPKSYSKEEKKNLDQNLGSVLPTPLSEYWVKKWKPQSKFTSADYDDNRYSLRRRPMSNLYLIVKSKENGKWLFPEGPRSNPHTLRSACEELFRNQMGRGVYGYFLSHAPIGHYVNEQDEKDMTFFYRATYVHGKPPFDGKVLSAKYEDHQWVSRQEIREYEFVDEKYQQVALDIMYEGDRELYDP